MDLLIASDEDKENRQYHDDIDLNPLLRDSIRHSVRESMGVSMRHSSGSLRVSKAPVENVPDIAILLNRCNVPLSVKKIIDYYIREPDNLVPMIILVDETLYSYFEQSWSNLWPKLVPSDELDIKVDLNCIDIRLGNKSTQNNNKNANNNRNKIRVLKFRSIDDLFNIMGSLKRVPLVQWWTEDHMFARELCLARGRRANFCDTFWINHIPNPVNTVHQELMNVLVGPSHSGTVAQMNELYSDLLVDYETRISKLRRQQANFYQKVGVRQRTGHILKAYLKLISKFRSMKPLTVSIRESIIRLRRFHSQSTNIISDAVWEGDSYVEISLRPKGVALILAKTETCVQSKHLMIELIFKNLILGNGVLVVCPANLLGRRFPLALMREFKLPFELIVFESNDQSSLIIANGTAAENQSTINQSNELASDCEQQQQQQQDHNTTTHHAAANMEQVNSESLEISSTPKAVRFGRSKACELSSSDSLDSGLHTSTSSLSRRSLKCPSSVYALDLNQAGGIATSAKVDDLVLTYGTIMKTIWCPDRFQLCSQPQVDGGNGRLVEDARLAYEGDLNNNNDNNNKRMLDGDAWDDAWDENSWNLN